MSLRCEDEGQVGDYGAEVCGAPRLDAVVPGNEEDVKDGGVAYNEASDFEVECDVTLLWG